MFEPRGHDIMSGSILYPPIRDDCDAGILFIETSGCLPMCGHGTIGTVTVAVEHGLVTPKRGGACCASTCRRASSRRPTSATASMSSRVRIRNVAWLSPCRGRRRSTAPASASSTFDVAYGGNFYAIIEPQKNYRDLADISAVDILRLSPIIRRLLNEKIELVASGEPDHPRRQPHPLDRAAAATRRPMPATPSSTARRPSTAPPAAPAPRRAWRSSPPGASSKVGDDFVHESIIGSLFNGRVESADRRSATTTPSCPSIAGQAWITGYNTIFLDDRDPYTHGFQLV